MELSPSGRFRDLIVIFSILFVSGWQFNLTGCRASLPPKDGNVSIGVVDRYGNPTENATNAQGYQYSKCLDVCGQGIDVNNFTTIVQQMTLWFLPYLTLLAQVPFFADDKIGSRLAPAGPTGSPSPWPGWPSVAQRWPRAFPSCRVVTPPNSPRRG